MSREHRRDVIVLLGSSWSPNHRRCRASRPRHTVGVRNRSDGTDSRPSRFRALTLTRHPPLGELGDKTFLWHACLAPRHRRAAEWVFIGAFSATGPAVTLMSRLALGIGRGRETAAAALVSLAGGAVVATGSASKLLVDCPRTMERGAGLSREAKEAEELGTRARRRQSRGVGSWAVYRRRAVQGTC